MLTAALIWFYFRDLANYLLDCAELRHQRKMAKSEVQKCLDWLFEQQGELECASFGQGESGVMKALSLQRAKAVQIKDFSQQIDKLVQNSNVGEEEAVDLKGKYSSVEALSSKRGSCFEVISQISGLQELVENLSTEFDSRAVHLVNTGDAGKPKGSIDQTNESMARTAQNCITAVRRNWKWILTTMQCSEVHLKNAAAYQEYFHEVEEAEYWMNTTLSRIHLSFDRQKLNGDRADARAILNEIRDVLLAYLQWQTKVDNLFDRSRNIVPVPLRLKKLTDPRPALVLVDFRSDEIELNEGETITIVDNSNRRKWRVTNSRGQTGEVPAVILVIPGPSGEAVDAAIRLRLQLLSLWTTSVKRLGYQMLAFMLIVFKDWDEDESAKDKVSILQCMNETDKLELLRILKYIEDTLGKNWTGYSDYSELEERMERLRMIMEEAPEGGVSDDELLSTVVVQIKTLEEMLMKYSDFWAYWETFKVIVELLKQPKHLLVCDKWDQLRYITTAHFVKFWDTHLDIEDIKKSQASLALYEKPREEMPVSSEVTVETQHEETTSEEVVSEEVEECHTFIVKGVLDPNNNNEMTLQEAIMKGIIDQGKGLYINPRSGRTMDVNEAINDGKILMEIVSKQKIREEKKTFGLITIKTTHETRPFSIQAVLDPHTDERLPLDVAMEKGILDSSCSEYRTDTGEKMPIADAISSGLVLVEYDEKHQPHAKPQVVTKTYSVSGVVDQLRKEKVPFSDAIRQGLLDKETGEYINNKTHQKISVHEAIMKGFIKARVVADPSKLDIDPENKIIIQKFENAKTKLLRGVKAMRMFKSLGKPLP
ncbi:uncharacterized protein LOC124285660 isoform X3 [Haliotis rubra]|uniref:uncharacterized protein LOC124285660 isoform X3 n=1 Tax=Haliotis rubra TaxID=36100 RepID=UPI001EE54BA9|nr:uncharacterized protein LOC124285660 isoform X3 [Haliotis rubra]